MSDSGESSNDSGSDRSESSEGSAVSGSSGGSSDLSNESERYINIRTSDLGKYDWHNPAVIAKPSIDRLVIICSLKKIYDRRGGSLAGLQLPPNLKELLIESCILRTDFHKLELPQSLTAICMSMCGLWDYPNLDDVKFPEGLQSLDISENHTRTNTNFSRLHLPDRLEELTLDGSILNGRHLETLRLPPGLRTLSMSGCRLTPSAVNKIRFPTSLTELNLSGSSNFEWIARLPDAAVDLSSCHSLEYLKLVGTAMTGTELAKFRLPPLLERINLSYSHSIWQGLSDVAFPPGLLDLDMGSCGVADTETDWLPTPQLLMAIQWPPQLQRLRLSIEFRPTADSPVCDLSALVFPPSLTQLTIQAVGLGDADLSTLRFPKGLRILNMALSDFSTATPANLSQLTFPAGLVELGLCEVGLSSGLTALQLPAGIEKLDLSENFISGAVLDRWNPPPNLRSLVVDPFGRRDTALRLLWRLPSLEHFPGSHDRAAKAMIVRRQADFALQRRQRTALAAGWLPSDTASLEYSTAKQILNRI